MSRISAYLGLNTTAFQAGIDRANTMLGRFKATLKAGDIGGGLKQALGAGAIIQAFRATISAAQEARDNAAQLGRSVDSATMAVARYGDAWDAAKVKITGAAITALSFFNRAGEGAGSAFADRFPHLIGEDGDSDTRRNRAIAEAAGTNADRLTSPEALKAAAQRGVEKRRAREKEADDKRAAMLREDERGQRLIAEAAERRAKTSVDSLPVDEQIAEAQQRIADFSKRSSDAKLSGMKRAEALNNLSKAEADLAEARRRKEEQIADAKKKQADHQKRVADAQERVTKAQGRFADASAAIPQAKRDALGFTPQELATTAGGGRDTTRAGIAAQRILRDEQAARNLRRSGRTVSMFDEKSQRNVEAGAEFFQQRALAARSQLGQLTSAEQNPFAQAEKDLRGAAADLKAAANDLKQVEVEVVSP